MISAISRKKINKKKVSVVDERIDYVEEISTCFNELRINKAQYSSNLSVILSPVTKNQWEREVSHILSWNPLWFTEYNDKFAEILPSLVMKDTCFKPNKFWGRLLKFNDYNLYRSRFHVLYRLELFQQILTGILTPPLSMFNTMKNKGQDDSNNSYGVSGAEFDINRGFGRRFVIEKICHYDKTTEFGKHDLVLLSNNGKYKNAVFGIVEAIKLRGKRQNSENVPENHVLERYEISYRCQIPLYGNRVFVQLVSPLSATSRQIYALEGLKFSPLIDSLLNPSLEVHSLRKVSKLPESDSLNKSQQKAVERIAADMKNFPGTPRIALVHGPPGTGKSTTILHLVQSLIAQNSHKGQILVCAASNAAVDSIAVKLIKSNVQFTRVGSVLMSSQVISHSLTEQFNSQRKYKKRAIFLSIQNVILSTLSCCGSETMRLAITPSIIIVDEASQASELDLNIALQLGCMKNKVGCRKLVLVGDHNQLPPTVLSKPAEKRHLDLSLFDRCHLNLETQNAKDKMMLLNTQYRMVEPIAHFPSKYVYDNKIITPKPGESGFRANPPGFPLLPFKFIDTGKNCGTETNHSDSRSLINKTEATHILRVCQEVLSCAKLMNKIEESKRELEIMEKEQNGKGKKKYGKKNNENEECGEKGEKASQENMENCGKREKNLGEEVVKFWGRQEDIGVISFYKAQVGHIKKILGQNGLRGIEVNTVDGFQGREKPIIIVSCVRTNLNTVGFLGVDYRRMNVAITRAKLSLYIIGCSDSLKRSKHWRCLMESAEQRGFLSRCNANKFSRVANVEIVKEFEKERNELQNKLKQKELQCKQRQKCKKNKKGKVLMLL